MDIIELALGLTTLVVSVPAAIIAYLKVGELVMTRWTRSIVTTSEVR